MIDGTIRYYDENADTFIQGTLSVDFHETQDKFTNKLRKDARILDFGCGSGRDTKHFLSLGFQVEAIDGSAILCKKASEYTGICVKQMFFQELNEVHKYDGIWACSSILHLSKAELKSVLKKMLIALKSNGVIYTSFKYSNFEGDRSGRYFTDFTKENFEKFIEDMKNISIEESWITGDVRVGREEEKWLNLILRKTNS